MMQTVVDMGPRAVFGAAFGDSAPSWWEHELPHNSCLLTHAQLFTHPTAYMSNHPYTQCSHTQPLYIQIFTHPTTHISNLSHIQLCTPNSTHTQLLTCTTTHTPNHSNTHPTTHTYTTVHTPNQAHTYPHAQLFTYTKPLTYTQSLMPMQPLLFPLRQPLLSTSSEH